MDQLQERTVTTPEDRRHVFIPFNKINDNPDGSITVYGYGTTEAQDADGEVMKLSAVKAAWPEYAKYGSIWEMHQPWIAGKLKQGEFDSKGLYLSAVITDSDAVKKCKAGSYAGWSIGGKVLEKKGNEITKIKIREFSLVDRPSNPETLIDAAKICKALPEGGNMTIEDAVPVEPVVPEIPAAAAVGAPVVEEGKPVQKMIGDLHVLVSAAQAFGELAVILGDEEAEKQDPVTFSDKLGALVEQIGAIIKEMTDHEISEVLSKIQEEGGTQVMTQEEVKETMAKLAAAKELAEQVLAKKGAKFSKQAMTELEEMHKELGECGDAHKALFGKMDGLHQRLGKFFGKEPAKEDKPAEDAKTEAPAAPAAEQKPEDKEEIKKILDAQAVTIQELQTKLAKIEAQPLPAATLGKGGNGGTKEAETRPAGAVDPVEIQELKKMALEGDREAQCKLTRAILTGKA